MKLWGILLFVFAAILGVAWWRKNFVISPLQAHYDELESRQSIGNMSQLSEWASAFPIAMWGTGWGTTARMNPTNSPLGGANIPGRNIFNFRFAQPTGGTNGFLYDQVLQDKGYQT